MEAAIFRLSRRSVFIQTLPSKEQDRGIGCLLPKIGYEGRGESACMAPQGITGRQLVSLTPLVVVELDMTVDPHWLCGADYASVKA